MGPSGRFYSCTCLMILMLGQIVFWVELLVQRRLCPIFMCGAGLLDIHDYRRLTGCQRTPGFRGIKAWYQSLGIRIPRELGFGYP